MEIPDFSNERPPLQRALAIAIVVASIAVPLATAFIAATFADVASKRDTSAKLIELSVAILREPPRPKTVDVRTWAMDVLDKYSEVKLSAEARRSLSDSLSLPLILEWRAQGGNEITSSGMFRASEIGRSPIIACIAGQCDTTWINVIAPTTARDSLKR